MQNNACIHEMCLLMTLAFEAYMAHKMLELIHFLSTFVKFGKYGAFYPKRILLPESTRQ
jgi:hypothetical protein